MANPALLPYLNMLRERIAGELFSKAKSPEIGDYVYLPGYDYQAIQTEKDFFNLVNGMALDARRWMKDKHYQAIKLERIRDHVAHLGDKYIAKIWNDEALNIDDQEKLKGIINKKLAATKRKIVTARIVITATSWITFAILCLITAGLFLLAAKYVYNHIKKDAEKSQEFLKKNFDEEAENEIEKQSEPYIKEINAAKVTLLFDKNQKANDGDVVKVPRDVIKAHLLPYLDDNSLKKSSVASRLLRDIIYTDTTKRYLHTPEPIIKQPPAIEWEKTSRV